MDVAAILAQLQESSGGEPLGVSVSAALDRASLLFADSSPGGAAPPLLELLVTEVQCVAQGVLGSAADTLDGMAKGTLCLEVYSAEKKVGRHPTNPPPSDRCPSRRSSTAPPLNRILVRFVVQMMT